LRSPAGDGGFPGLAVFSLLGFAVVLALIALLGLKPWEADSVEPRLKLPGFEAAVGESVALPPERGAFVADATVVPLGAQPLKTPAERPIEAEAPSTALAVAPARLVAVAEVPSAPAPEPGAGEEAPSVGATDGEAPPEGVSSPVSTSLPEPEPGGPVTAGGPILESCDGDKYVITIVLTPDADEAEEASVEIVLQRFAEDGSVDELRLEGDLLDAEALAIQLSSEGNCVYLEADASMDEDAPSDGTSQVVVPAEGASSSVPTPASP
jgi:hypothetical protein